MNWNWPDNKRIALLLSFDIDAENSVAYTQRYQ